MIKNPLFFKILMVFTLPALGILYFSSILVYDKIITLSEIDNIQNDIAYISATKKVIKDIQRERAYSSIHINTIFSKEELNLQKQKTNKSYKDFLSTVYNINQTSNLNFDVKKIKKEFSKIYDLREQIEKKQISANLAVHEFSNITQAFLESLFSIKPVKHATQFNQNFSYVINLLFTLEYSSLDKVLISNYIQEAKISKKIYEKLLKTQTLEELNLKQFLHKSTIFEKQIYEAKLNINVDEKIKFYRKNITNLVNENKITLEKWQKLTLNRIESFEQIYSFVLNELLFLAHKLENSATKAQIFSLSFLFICFITLISLLFVLRNIIYKQQNSYYKLRKQQYIYRVLNKINKTILKIKNRKKLFDRVLSIITRDPNVSIGLIYKVKKSEKKLILTKGFLKDEVEFYDGEEKNALIRRSILFGKNTIVNSKEKILKNSILSPSFVQKHDINALGIFPVKRFEKIVAVLVLFSKNKEYFDKEIEILFNKSIVDIEYALEKLVYEKTKAKQEEELTLASYAFESNEPMLITNNEAKIINVNQAFCNTLGYEKKDIIGNNPKIFKSDEHSEQFYEIMWTAILKDGVWSGEIYNKTKSGDNIPLKATITAIKDKHGKTKHYLSQYNDISEQKLKQQYLEYQATHDSLTALPNRLLLLDRIEHTVNKVARYKTYAGLVFIDLDNFKTINDTLGHETGDILLIEVAKKLQATVRKEDTISRIGGDEFIVLADYVGEDKASARNAMQILASKIKGALNDIKTINGYENISTPSIGITLFKDDTFKVKELIKQADTAMYMAKRAGKNSIKFFE